MKRSRLQKRIPNMVIFKYKDDERMKLDVGVLLRDEISKIKNQMAAEMGYDKKKIKSYGV